VLGRGNRQQVGDRIPQRLAASANSRRLSFEVGPKLSAVESVAQTVVSCALRTLEIVSGLVGTQLTFVQPHSWAARARERLTEGLSGESFFACWSTPKAF
jgi:hypothetical protein